MKLFFIVLNVGLFLSTSSMGVVRTIPKNNLIEAIIYVESRGDINAYNAKENAVGCLQIRPIMLREVNRLLGYNKYKLTDRWNKEKSIQMFNVIKKHTTNPTDEKLARNWNGGWNGYKKQSTLKYWHKVKEQL
jgi:soluble lytic murein transglycosylase-like protein